MIQAARLSAAIEVLSEIDRLRRPSADALKDWGLSHRFAGSGDRAAIAGLVYDALRRRASSAFIMGEETPRAVLFGMLHLERGMDAAAIGKLTDGSRFAPEPLTDVERSALDNASLADAPGYIAGDYPQWLDPHFAKAFGGERGEEGAALASRAPLDLRVNPLKGDRGETAEMLAALKAEPTRWSPAGLRIVLGADSRSPSVHSEPAFIKGQIEIQDEGSQLAALFANARPGEKVIDLCAGAGGKTLALAAAMENKGELHASDLDKRRLAPIHARLDRAGVKIVKVHTPRRENDGLSALAGQADLVFVDAPCTGTGSWRRNPDAKWRMRPGALEQRIKDQVEVLDRAAKLVRSGGRIVYVTCSVLDEENGEQVRAFLTRHASFAVASAGELPDVLGERAFMFKRAVRMTDEGLLMTPRMTGTDGFFVSMLRKG